MWSQLTDCKTAWKLWVPDDRVLRRYSSGPAGMVRPGERKLNQI